MSKRKKTPAAAPPEAAKGANESHESEDESNGSVTTVAAVSADLLERSRDRDGGDVEEAIEDIYADVPEDEAAAEGSDDDADSERESERETDEDATDERTDHGLGFDSEMTVNLVGELPLPGRDDLDAPTVAASGEALEEVDRVLAQRKHLRGLLEALVFASDSPIKTNDLAKLASATQKQVKDLLVELKQDYATRGVHLDEVAGGWVFRTSPQYGNFIRDLTKQKPVRLSRAQVETLAIIAYRQPITRPEIDDVRGVDSGPVLKVLLERDLVRILGKRDEPGRPIIYGTTTEFLEFFGLKSLKDLPTLREFTELTDESRATYENVLGEPPDEGAHAGDGEGDGEDDDGISADLESELAGLGEGIPSEAPGPSADEDEDDRDLLGMLEDAGGGSDDDDAHASDDDGPTLTSEAPTEHDDED